MFPAGEVMKRLTALVVFLGALFGVIGGGASLMDRINQPTVVMKISKAPLRLAPNLIEGAKSDDAIFGDDLGVVTIEIINGSPAPISSPTLQLQNLSNFRGLVVVDGSLREKANSYQHEWKNKKGDKGPTFNLPAFGIGDTLILEAFGTDWKAADPLLTGALNIRKEWIIPITDSKAYHMLFSSNLRWIALIVFPVLCLIWGISLLRQKTEHETPVARPGAVA
jgi:hypothetical protein